MERDEYLSALTYRLSWSEEDRSYVAECIEFPSLSAVDADRYEALRSLEEVVAESVDWLIEDSQALPEPIGAREFKGRISLRIPPDTHRKISFIAAEQDVSLNQYITTLIDQSAGSNQHHSEQIESMKSEISELSALVHRLLSRMPASIPSESLTGQFSLRSCFPFVTEDTTEYGIDRPCGYESSVGENI